MQILEFKLLVCLLLKSSALLHDPNIYWVYWLRVLYKNINTTVFTGAANDNITFASFITFVLLYLFLAQSTQCGAEVVSGLFLAAR